jgi:phosphatidate cytidylyltransferase
VRDLQRRTITALIYAAIVLVAAFAPPIVFAAVLIVTAVLALAEIVALRRAGFVAVTEAVLVIAGCTSLYFLRTLSGSAPSAPLLIAIFGVWAADVAAYAVGSSFGKRKIAPAISPGQTWEGTIAGFLAAAAVVLAVVAPNGIFVWAALAAVTIGPVAFAGDLLESWLKRRAGVKDSGTLLPGHGGVLDRIDSLLAVGPLVALLILLTGRMG